jgi:hypothetical protein
MIVSAEPNVRILLVLSRDVLDRARTLAGRMTATLKLPVSLQVVLRALIEEALRREDHPELLKNIESHAEAVRERRRAVRTVDRRGGARRRPRRA